MGTCREAAQEDLRPRLTVQFVMGDGTQKRPLGLDSNSGSSSADGVAAAAAGDADSTVASTAAGSATGDAQDAASAREATDGSGVMQPQDPASDTQREDSRAAKPELDVASMASDAQGKLAEIAASVGAGVNSTSDAVAAQLQDGYDTASGVLFSSTPAGKALMVAGLLLLLFCLYIVRAALARRKARTGGARPGGGGSNNRLNRFLARRRTAESDAAKP